MRMVLLSLAVSVASCGGDGGEGGAIAPMLSEIESKVFARSCTFSSCHGDTTPREGLSLVAPAWDALVGVGSTQMPGRVRVKPGEPEASYLIEKLTRAMPGSGDRMPQGQPVLEPAALSAIRAWIQKGALRD
jgi:predicted CxxxxCH...CXXCH cytochrome family protein